MLFLFTCLFWSNVHAIPAPGHGALLGYCDTSAHCEANECCVSFIQPRKRLVLDTIDPDLAKFVHGSCQLRGTAGSDCYIGSVMPSTDGLYYDCPCASGFTCHSTGIWALDKGTLGKCEPSHAKKAVGQPCHYGADCAANECCVSDLRPIGKRQPISATFAHCQPMGTDGSGCLVSLGSGKPNGTTYQCPCMDGLTCHGSGMFDIPLGETGTCGQ